MGVLVMLVLHAAAVPAGPATSAPDQDLLALQDALSGAIAAGRSSVVSIRARHLSPGQGQVESAGAGIFIDPRGILITNYHLVGNAHEVEVEVWHGGTPRYYAWVMAADGSDMRRQVRSRSQVGAMRACGRRLLLLQAFAAEPPMAFW